MVKMGTINTCRNCNSHCHNIPNCPLMKKRCGRCKIKGRNVSTCNKPLDEVCGALIGDDEAAEIERARLVMAQNAANASNRSIIANTIIANKQGVEITDSPVPGSSPHQLEPPSLGIVLEGSIIYGASMPTNGLLLPPLEDLDNVFHEHVDAINENPPPATAETLNLQ